MRHRMYGGVGGRQRELPPTRLIPMLISSAIKII